MSLVSIMFACLLSVGVLADEPAQEEVPLTRAGIEAAERKELTPENAEALQRMLNAPSGVFDPEYDDDGILIRLKIKGEAAVPRMLGAARAEINARQSAERNARAAFVRFLREEVSFLENERQEVIIVEKDGEEQVGFKQVETRFFEARANGVLRGLIVLDERFTGEGANRRATVTFGWSQKLADAARTAQAEMARERNPVTLPGTIDRGIGTPSTGDRSRTAGNLTDF
jgi:hypothetical protein